MYINIFRYYFVHNEGYEDGGKWLINRLGLFKNLITVMLTESRQLILLLFEPKKNSFITSYWE